MYRIGWFSTGRDEAARNLLQTIWKGVESGDLNAEVSFVYSNRKPGESPESDLFFRDVESYQIDLICFSSQRFKPGLRAKDIGRWRAEYDKEMLRRVEKYHTEINMLSGYMLILSELAVEKLVFLNLHPAKPGGPTGTWQEVIRELINKDAEDTGVMIHRVTPVLDRGPVLTYCTFPIKGKSFNGLSKEKLFWKIREEGERRELPLLLLTLKKLSSGEINLAKGNYDLTTEIESIIQ